MPRRALVGPLVVIALLAGGCFGGQGNVFSLEVGDCFDDPTDIGEQVSDVTIVDCDSRHDNEVYASFDIAGAEYPGPEEVFELARVGCVERFEDYVGVDLDSSRLAATFLAPTEQSWNNSDDREVICYLLDRGGLKLESSMEGSGS